MLFRKKTNRIKLQTGAIRFVVPVDDGTENWDADLITLQMAIEPLELLNSLVRVDGRLQATQEFLEALVEKFTALGCPRCTVSMARQIWISVGEQFNLMDATFRKNLAKVR